MLTLVSKVSICLFCVGMEFLGGNGVTYKINVDAADIICCPVIWIWLLTRACFLSMSEPDLTYEKTCYISIVFSHWWRPCSVIERKWKSYSKHLVVFCYHWIFYHIIMDYLIFTSGPQLQMQVTVCSAAEPLAPAGLIALRWNHVDEIIVMLLKRIYTILCFNP